VFDSIIKCDIDIRKDLHIGLLTTVRQMVPPKSTMMPDRRSSTANAARHSRSTLWDNLARAPQRTSCTFRRWNWYRHDHRGDRIYRNHLTANECCTSLLFVFPCVGRCFLRHSITIDHSHLQPRVFGRWRIRTLHDVMDNAVCRCAELPFANGARDDSLFKATVQLSH
jgi:hypothetical protein